jgi:hypothetical protein
MERRKDLTGRNSFKLVKQGERGISQKREQENWKVTRAETDATSFGKRAKEPE